MRSVDGIESREMWSLPWHALQSDLATGMLGDAAAGYAASLEALKVQRVTHSGSSWLNCSRRRVKPPSS